MSEAVTPPVRADARKNIEALIDAARAVFAEVGVDAPVRDIADRAGVGMGTMYRHFPQRSDLIIAVSRREIESCAEAAAEFAATLPPFEALERWIFRFVDFVTAKRGLASALHSNEPAFENLHRYFHQRMEPALQGLLDAAAGSEDIRVDVAADDLLRAISRLCVSGPDGVTGNTRLMIGLLVDGMRRR